MGGEGSPCSESVPNSAQVRTGLHLSELQALGTVPSPDPELTELR